MIFIEGDLMVETINKDSFINIVTDIKKDIRKTQIKTFQQVNSNLINLYASLSNISIEEVEDKFKEYNYGAFKKDVADLVVTTLLPIQEKYNNIINSSILDQILDMGKNKTSILAKEKYEQLKDVVGLHK